MKKLSTKTVDKVCKNNSKQEKSVASGCGQKITKTS